MTEVLAVGLIFLVILDISQAVSCYHCVDCANQRGTLFNCSPQAQTSSCYYTKHANGTVMKTCGDEVLDYITSEGCSQIGRIELCRCSSDGCNDQLPSTPQVTATQQPPEISRKVTNAAIRVTTPTTRRPSSVNFDVFNSERRCYVCVDCGSSVGISYSCASFSSSRNCYLSQDPTGEITRSCGFDEIDDLHFRQGCTVANGYKLCKCSSSNCNAFLEEVAPGVISLITARMTTIAPTTTTTTPTTTTTLRTTAVVNLERRCLICFDCATSRSFSLSCRSISNSRNCYQLQNPDGLISRSCGFPEIEALGLPEGCSEIGGYKVCKCSTNNCNSFIDEVSPNSIPSPEMLTRIAIRTTTTTTTTAIPTTTTAASRHCLICVDCGSSRVFSSSCESVSDSRNCYLSKNPEGQIIRSCGFPEIDAMDFETGCNTLGDYIFCKCSTDNCNSFPEINA